MQAGFLPRAAVNRGSDGVVFFLYHVIPWYLTCSTNEKCFLVGRCDDVSTKHKGAWLRPDDLSSVFRLHTVEGGNRLPEVVLTLVL